MFRLISAEKQEEGKIQTILRAEPGLRECMGKENGRWVDKTLKARIGEGLLAEGTAEPAGERKNPSPLDPNAMYLKHIAAAIPKRKGRLKTLRNTLEEERTSDPQEMAMIANQY